MSEEQGEAQAEKPAVTRAGYPKKPAPVDPATGEPIKRGRGRPPGPRTKSEHESELEAEVARLKAMLAEAEANTERIVPATLEQTAAPLPEVALPEAEAITINFVNDGLTALGKVWYRGETLTVRPGTTEWDEVHDRNGDTWLHLDEWEQEARFGERKFRPGAWKGNGFDLDDPELSEKDRAVLARVQSAFAADSERGARRAQ